MGDLIEEVRVGLVLVGKLEMRWNGASGFVSFDLRGVVGGGE